MPAVLTVGVAEKSPADRVRLPCDFGDEPLLIKVALDGWDLINSYSVNSSPDGLTVSGLNLDYPFQLSALVEGGVSGQQYDVVYQIAVNDGDESVISRTGVLKVL